MGGFEILDDLWMSRCESCGNVFVRQVDLKKHMDGKHARLWDFYCVWCGEVCSGKGRMKTHEGLEQGYIS